MRRFPARVLALLVLVALAAPAGLAGQDAPRVPLERFVQQVARLWAQGDADALVALAPASGRLMLDLGADAGGSVQGRHATAALRSLFAVRETASLRPSRVTVSGSRQGFGEFHWVYRSRGMSSQQTASVYFGVVWEENAWRIREIRVFS